MPGKRDSIGLSGLSSQVARRVNKKGFDFCFLVAGESGLGKSTLVNSLFLNEERLSEPEVRLQASQRIEKTVHMEVKTTQLTEKGVQLKLTTVDTPGFGDAVDNDECWQPIVEYIDRAFETYLRDESKVDRTKRQDDRVHCMLYFISPVGHGLKPVDVATLRALHNKVNIVPLIAKADTFTKPELKAFKEKVLADLAEHQINYFQPAMDEDDDEETHIYNLKIRSNMPFAVVGSDTVFEVAGKGVRGRQYPWGVVEVDNEEHCDFQLLRDMLVRTHLQELKDVTNEILYENFRTQALATNPMMVSRAEETILEASVVAPAAKSGESEEMERMKAMLAEQARQLEAQRKQFELERQKYQSMQQQAASHAPHGDSEEAEIQGEAF
eukprot:m.292886 g.292886  ORF g.292886 m.292886 type:complete len:383 (+) comp19489_c1_seq3:111-1259(+)